MNWIKPKRCDSNACVEVGQSPDTGRVYARQNINGYVSNSLSFTVEEWSAFIEGVKAGDFDNLGG